MGVSREREGLWIVVLGVSSGTGAAIARAAAREGFNVFGVHRGHYMEQAQALTAEIQRLGRRIHLALAVVRRAALAARAGAAAPMGAGSRRAALPRTATR